MAQKYLYSVPVPLNVKNEGVPQTFLRSEESRMALLGIVDFD